MKSFCRYAILVIISASLVQAQAKIKSLDLTFTTIDVPGATGTEVLGINQAGDMVGDTTKPCTTGTVSSSAVRRILFSTIPVRSSPGRQVSMIPA